MFKKITMAIMAIFLLCAMGYSAPIVNMHGMTNPTAEFEFNRDDVYIELHEHSIATAGIVYVTISNISSLTRLNFDYVSGSATITNPTINVQKLLTDGTVFDELVVNDGGSLYIRDTSKAYVSFQNTSGATNEVNLRIALIKDDSGMAYSGPIKALSGSAVITTNTQYNFYGNFVAVQNVGDSENLIYNELGVTASITALNGSKYIAQGAERLSPRKIGLINFSPATDGSAITFSYTAYSE